MRRDDYGHAGIGKRAELLRDDELELRVKPLRRLVEQKQGRLGEQHLRQSQKLLLPARKIIRMPVAKPFKASPCANLGDIVIRIAACGLPLRQLFANRIAYEQGLGVLWKQGLIRLQLVLQRSALRLHRAGDHMEKGCLAAAVASDERMDAAAANRQVQAAQDPVVATAVAHM